MIRNKIFYNEKSNSAGEIAESLARYLFYVRNEPCEEVNLNDFKKEKYFDKIYPAKFEGYSLYFILDDNLEDLEDKKLTKSGLIFSMIVDLSISNSNKYEIFVIKREIENYIKYNGIELNQNCYGDEGKGDKKNVPNFVETNKLLICKYDALLSVISHGHSGINENERKNIEKEINGLLNQSSEAKEPMNTKTTVEKEPINTKTTVEIENSIFVLIIDDVLGDYSKTFLPFYTYIKSELNKENKNLIMRGIYDILPDKLVNFIRNFPADIILVDIDFEALGESWEKNINYQFYYTKGKNLAGVKLYGQLLSFTGTGLFTKKPEIFVFTGIKKSQNNKNEKWIGKNETAELINNLSKFKLSNDYIKNIEDVFKKIVYLRKYIEIKDNFKDDLIWQIIILKPQMSKESGEREQNYEEIELVKQNWIYFNKIYKQSQCKIYTGLEDIKFDDKLKPILGEDRVKIAEQKKGDKPNGK